MRKCQQKGKEGAFLGFLLLLSGMGVFNGDP